MSDIGCGCGHREVVHQREQEWAIAVSRKESANASLFKRGVGDSGGVSVWQKCPRCPAGVPSFHVAAAGHPLVRPHECSCVVSSLSGLREGPWARAVVEFHGPLIQTCVVEDRGSKDAKDTKLEAK